MICEVIVDIKNNQVNRSFDYLIPQHLEGFLEVGHRVKVIFGNRVLLGFVIKIKEFSDFDSTKLKEIKEVLDIIPPLNKEFIELAKYMADYYFTFYISALETMIPSALKVKYQREIVLIDKERLPLILREVFIRRKSLKLSNKYSHYFEAIKEGISNNSLQIRNVISDKGNVSSITMIGLNNSDELLPIRSKKGFELYEYLTELREDISKSELVNDMGYTAEVINNLIAKNILIQYEKETYRKIGLQDDYADKVVDLNEEQQEAYNLITSKLLTNETFLLHGVTGSGKTEVYLRLIKDCIDASKEAIMLVPEISLTPQMVQRVKARFNDNVAVLHSGLSMGEKYDEWRKVMRHEVKIVVGARSAIFAPFTKLGLIIIDEEHEGSYKQDVNPKYDAIHIAKMRAKYHQATLVLGSATPSITSYYSAKNGDIKLVELKKRANALKMPKCQIVDMRVELKSGNKSIFSNDLLYKLKDVLQKNEQAILFLNRRGHSSFVMCRECGEVIKCPHCDITLTYHQIKNKLKCHYCGYEINNVDSCPKCQSHLIRYVGGGTQKVCEEVNRYFPEARVLRVDYDTTSKKNASEMMFNSFAKQEADILVGTQIIAKGLDFKNVTLVGVLNADLSLKLPFYDAFETTFDLLCQVSGRSGRDLKEGRVVVQSYDVDNYAIVKGSKHDYLGFYEIEIENRRLLNNPPFSELVEIIISASTIELAKATAYQVQKKLQESHGVKIFGPMKHPIFKMKDLYRFMINIKFLNNSLEILSFINEIYQNKKDIFISITRM